MLSNHLENNLDSNKMLNATYSSFKMFVVGILITAITQSSTAITALTISLINSKTLNLKSGLSIVLGSNIGTAATSLITGLDIINYPLLFIVGFIITLSNKKIIFGKALIYISFLFMGIEHLKTDLVNLQNNINIIKYFAFFNNSIVCSYIGGTILTFIFQSSSAIIAITQQMCSSKILNMVAGLSVVLGANVGTTISGIVLSLNTNEQTKVLSIANLLINLIFSCVFILVIPVLNIYSSKHESIYIGVFQLFFNIISSVLGFILIDWFIKISYIFIKKKTA